MQDRYEAQERQRETYLNLAHQLRSPVLTAHWIASFALEGSIQDSDIRNALLRIKGLCAKAQTVIMSANVLADLAAGRAIAARVKRIEVGELLRIVIECAGDATAALDANRNLRFDVEKQGDFDRRRFDHLADKVVVVGDVELLRGVFASVLDNAGKYAKSGTTVRISASLTRSGHFHITVYNKPFLRPRHAEKWAERSCPATA